MLDVILVLNLGLPQARQASPGPGVVVVILIEFIVVDRIDLLLGASKERDVVVLQILAEHDDANCNEDEQEDHEVRETDEVPVRVHVLLLGFDADFRQSLLRDHARTHSAVD